ncbi:hypothetical protein ILYODFUR_019967 [Ilyodon furcidens]|uniref:Uncharacterized protein n=1 Tax=Ilyodon furcidens TaxID=33524 RepID=A0ABV0U9R7_9TELE
MTQPDKKNTGTQSQSHIPTLLRTHKNTHTRKPNVKTHNNGRCTLTCTPHKCCILLGPGTNTTEGPPTPGGPLHSGVETGRLSEHQSRLVPALPRPNRPRPKSKPPSPTPTPNDPCPHRGPQKMRDPPG